MAGWGRGIEGPVGVLPNGSWNSAGGKYRARQARPEALIRLIGDRWSMIIEIRSTSMFPAKLIRYILAAMMLSICMVEAKSDDADQKDFRDRLTELHARIDSVSDALEGADGYPRKAGLIDLQVARFFADYIAWELDHPELMAEALGSSEFFEGIEHDQSECLRRYRFHLDHELTGSMKVLNQAFERIASDKKWPEIREPRWDEAEFEDGFFRVDGEPVFFGGFNMLLSMGVTNADRFPGWRGKDCGDVWVCSDGLADCYQP